MGLFSKIFQGNADDAAIKAARESFLDSTRPEMAMTKAGFIEAGSVKGRLAASAGIGAASLGAVGYSVGNITSPEDTWTPFKNSAMVGAAVGGAVSFAVNRRRGQMGRILGSVQDFAHQANTGIAGKKFSFSEAVQSSHASASAKARVFRNMDDFESMAYDDAVGAFNANAKRGGRQKFVASAKGDNAKRAQQATQKAAAANRAAEEPRQPFKGGGLKTKATRKPRNPFERATARRRSTVNEQNAARFNGVDSGTADAIVRDKLNPSGVPKSARSSSTRGWAHPDYVPDR